LGVIILSTWLDVDLTEVSTDNDVLPESTYFDWELLPGAKPSDFDANRINCAAKVASGEFTGRVKYFSYPDPAKQPWVLGVFRRLVNAIGEEIEKGEEPIAYLNRVAGAGFSAPVKHSQKEAEGMDAIFELLGSSNS